MFKDDTNEMVKITYAALASSSKAFNSVTDFLGGPRNRGDRDICSIGSLAYQLLSGGREPPTSVDGDDEDSDRSSRNRKKQHKNIFMSTLWKRIPVSREAKNFIESAMNHGFVTVLQALQHRWITQESVYMQGTGSPFKKAEHLASLCRSDLSTEGGSSSERGQSMSDRTEQSRNTAPIVAPLSQVVNTDEETKEELDAEHGDCDILAGDLPTAITEEVFIELESDQIDDDESESSDEESVGALAPPPVQPVVVMNDMETVRTQELISCESSDEESVGVIAAPQQPEEDKLAPAVPPPPPTESPRTPKQSPRAFVPTPMSPSSPSLTPADFRDLRDVFQQVHNNEGEVSADILRERLRSTNYTEEEVNSWFTGTNFDDSRNLNYKIFLNQAIQSRRRIERRRVEEAFQKIDKGKQGFVTVGNLRAVLGTENSDYIEKLMKAADTKHDGRITYEKFKDVLEQSFRTEL